MQTKLTLRMDTELINKAKRYSSKTGKSVSQLVANYFTLLEDSQEFKEEELSPWIRRLHGAIAGSKLEEKDYRRYLEKKYK